MNGDMDLSLNTKAILLLTAPLIAGGVRGGVKPLTAGEYNKLAGRLHALGVQPSDLLKSHADFLLSNCSSVADTSRLTALLGRGFALAQAVRRWQTRAIWVVSRADGAYPRMLKERLRKDAPALLYGCGNREMVGARSALAIVGSRNVDESILHYVDGISALASKAGCPIVSGAARGVDQAAMNGVLNAGGLAVGVLAGNLERTSMSRTYRNLLLEKRLLLVSPYDPGARFNVGHAMQRNKVIYALANVALVVHAVVNKGGTWAGAVEQLRKYSTPVHVRSHGDELEALNELQRRGAKSWPNPTDPGGFKKVLESTRMIVRPYQLKLSPTPLATDRHLVSEQAPSTSNEPRQSGSVPEELLQAIRSLMLRLLAKPKTAKEVSKVLNVTIPQAENWLNKLAVHGELEKRTRPVEYVHLTHDLVQERRSVENMEPIQTTRAESHRQSNVTDDYARELRDVVRHLILRIVVTPKTARQVSVALGVREYQARQWLNRLAEEDVLQKHTEPVTYIRSMDHLFEERLPT